MCGMHCQHACVVVVVVGEWVGGHGGGCGGNEFGDIKASVGL
jgi:hypothetical protein